MRFIRNWMRRALIGSPIPRLDPRECPSRSPDSDPAGADLGGRRAPDGPCRRRTCHDFSPDASRDPLRERRTSECRRSDHGGSEARSGRALVHRVPEPRGAGTTRRDLPHAPRPRSDDLPARRASTSPLDLRDLRHSRACVEAAYSPTSSVRRRTRWVSRSIPATSQSPAGVPTAPRTRRSNARHRREAGREPLLLEITADRVLVGACVPWHSNGDGGHHGAGEDEDAREHQRLVQTLSRARHRPRPPPCRRSCAPPGSSVPWPPPCCRCPLHRSGWRARPGS